MTPDRSEFGPALAAAHDRALEFLAGLNERAPGIAPRARDGTALPDEGIGAAAAIEQLWADYGEDFAGSSGPRYWGFVHGGLTPAALAADWLCSTVDQTGQMHGDSPSVLIERDAIAMLRDLFGLPSDFVGNFVSGGTMANATCLAVGLQALGAARGINVSQEGVAALGGVRILSGEHHASIAQGAAMLGLGRDSVESLAREPGRERVSIYAVAERLDALGGRPVILVGNAGTVTTGDFDDLDALADLAEHHGAHFHVDGAFGLFAAASPRHAGLVKGIERAGTIAGDAHKWLNVPYDSGFVFSRHLDHQIEMFKSPSAYLPPAAADPLGFQNMSPENSRRVRALPASATLLAYGRDGYRGIVESCASLAELLAERIAAEPGFELLAPVRLNVVCFALAGADADATRAFVERVRRDGRVVISPSVLFGRACLRAALINWRTQPADIDVAIEALRTCRD
jgi:glutamate/tyrosine decarboxylase-like PLP-dependent enzyme